MLAVVSVIIAGVVDDPVGAQGAHQFNVPGATDAGDIRPHGFCYLHGKSTDASCGSINQDLLPGLKVSFVAKSLQGGEACDRNAAACSNVRASGFGTNFFSGAHAYSANAPLPMPNTASPD